MKNETLLKDFLTKKQFKIFINDRLNRRGKIKRFSSFGKIAIIIEVKFFENYAFVPSNLNIQSVDFKRKIIVYTCSNKEYRYILNEVNFFRKYPKDAEKLNFTVI